VVVVVVVVVHEVSKQWQMRGINSKEEKEQQYRGKSGCGMVGFSASKS